MTRTARFAAVALASLLAFACVSTKPQPVPAHPGEKTSGLASWYGQEFAGRTTANGEIFDPMLLTAAHRTLPFGTVLRVVNPKTGKSVDVRVNDRGPFVGERVIDLSYAAAQQIGLTADGVGTVDITVLSLGQGDREPPAPYVVSIGKQPQTVPESTAPPVAFPLPSDVKAPAPSPEPAPTTEERESAAGDDTFAVSVEEVHNDEPVRRTVSADGTTIVDATPSGVVVGKADPRGSTAPARSPAEVTTGGRTTTTTTTVTTAPTAATAFVIQLGAFASEKNANDLRKRVAAILPSAYVEKNGELFRVRVGPFDTRAKAIDARERLESAGLSGIVMPR